MRLRWKNQALSDRERIARHIAQAGSPMAARKLDKEFVDKAHAAAKRPKLYRAGRVGGTRELIVRPNYVMIYRIEAEYIDILRVLHAAQQWPSAGTALSVVMDEVPSGAQ